MGTSLPPDVLVLICEELANKQDFGTLFKCALSGRTLVTPSIEWLYRVADPSTLFNTDTTDAETKTGISKSFQATRNQQIHTVSKWTLLWKSIIRSSIAKTAHPYALYIRSLDLRNLTELLEDTLFRDYTKDSFFAGDMAQFLRAKETPLKRRTREGALVIGKQRLDVPIVLDLVGEAITRFVSESAKASGATVALEEIAPGPISSAVLPRWIGRVSRLRTMTLWDAAVLNEDAAKAIDMHCPNFNDLSFFSASNDSEADLASFFGALRSNSLEHVGGIGAKGVGPETLLALNNHSSSLKRLKLDALRSPAIKSLSLLQGCIALESLTVSDSDRAVNLETTENDVFLEVVAWLNGCPKLRELKVERLISGPSILMHVCLNNSTRLHTLQVGGYSMVGNQEFHRALSHQTALESLTLDFDPEGAFRDDIEALVSSVSQIKGLKILSFLGESAGYFGTSEIVRLANNLKALEQFTFSGYDVTDGVWPAISGLRNLRLLYCHAQSSFSLDGILGYISTLRHSNDGLNLSIVYQNGDYDLTDREQSLIRKTIKEKMNGEFAFTLYREGESDSDSDSD